MKNDISEYLKGIGKKGGKSTLDRHGTDHYKRISQLAVAAKKKNKDKINKQMACTHEFNNVNIEACSLCGFHAGK